MDSYSCHKYLPAGFRGYCLLLAGLLMLCVACGAKKTDPPPEVNWDFKAGAVQITYQASPDLNEYNNSPHTMILMVYQLSEASDFKNYIQSPDGIKRLLNLYDPDERKTVSLKNLEELQRFVVSPGTKKTLTLDRVKDARWIGLVAGYFNSQPEFCSAALRIPVKRTKEGLIRKKISVEPADLHINIELDANQMHTSRDAS